jgi:putative transposase
VVSAPARRIAALSAIERGLPQRRACALMHIARSSLRYVPTMPIKNAPVVSAMQRLSKQYPRYGSLRIRVFLGREGMAVGKENMVVYGQNKACRYHANGHGDGWQQTARVP